MTDTALGRPRERSFQRFSVSQRLQHGVQIVTFTTLCFTGLLQKFSSNESLETLIALIGGVERLRLVHRTAAAVFVLEALYHALELGWLILVKRSRMSMLPVLKDARDALQMFKYFLGRTTQKPQFDRFDFKQKVEYLSLIWGSAVMISTGILMWFPVQATFFLPGEVIPAARVAHGGEGLLACLVIFTWHMYSAHFTPEVFPFDTTIFTGRISESRMIHEHPLEYARMMARLALQASSDASANAPNLVSLQASSPTEALPAASAMTSGFAAANTRETAMAEEELSNVDIEYLDDDDDPTDPTSVFAYERHTG
jgi:formate dehydrogenase subunit gamma